jgi:glycosyltransferase involved in cell wall biosynthesis
MKILYISPFAPARDGIGAYTSALGMAVLGEGHDVRVVVPRLMPGSTDEVLGAIGSGPGEFVALRDVIVKWNPDVVHVQFAVAAFGTRTTRLVRLLNVLRRELRAPIVVTMHEVTRDIALLRTAGRALYRRIACCCDKVIVHTDAAFNALTDSVGVPTSRVIVIPHPSARTPAAGSTPDDLRARFGLGSARILLAFGFIHIDKGLGDLVRALGILRLSATVPVDDIRVVVAGAVRPRHGPFRAFEARDRFHLARVLCQARGHALRRHLVLTGYVPDTDIAAWFGAAEAVVLPYRRTDQSGVAALANAFGVPVLASMAGGLGEQFADSRWTFPPRSPEHLAQVLADFLSAPPHQRVTVSRPRQACDMATIAAATLDVYLTARASITEDLRRVG